MKRAILGPFYQESRTRRYAYFLLVLVLTVITQLGGLWIWPFLSMNPNDVGWKFRCTRIMYPIASYMFGSLFFVPLISPLWGMKALSCSSNNHLRPHSIRTCIFFRNYIDQKAYTTLKDIEQNMERMFPRSPVMYFDAGFPIPYMHMFPHLNHAKGDSIDLSFLWKAPNTNAYKPPPSPIGYGGFVQPSTPRICNPNDVYVVIGRLALDLRWDYAWISPLLSDAVIDNTKTKALLNIIATQPRVLSITLEPHLSAMFPTTKNISNSCKIARHDDHVHITFDSNP